MSKYDGLRGQELLEIEDPDKEGGITLIFKDNRYLFIKIRKWETCHTINTRMMKLFMCVFFIEIYSHLLRCRLNRPRSGIPNFFYCIISCVV